MTQPIGERVASLEASVNAFHTVTGAALQKLAKGQEGIASEARAASKDAHLAVTAAEKAADSAAKAHDVDLLVHQQVRELKVVTDDVNARLDYLSLNGHGPDLKVFVTEDLPVVRELVQHAKNEAIIKAHRRATWWWWLGGWALKLAIPAAAGSGLYALVSYLLH